MRQQDPKWVRILAYVMVAGILATLSVVRGVGAMVNGEFEGRPSEIVAVRVHVYGRQARYYGFLDIVFAVIVVVGTFFVARWFEDRIE